jgi:hypothetical protein
MSWFASIATGVLTGAFGAVCALLAATAAVEWLRVSSFEGAAGYFVVLNAFLAFIAGLVIGIVASRFLGGPGWPGFFVGLGWSALLMGGAVAIVSGFAWLTADREPLVAGRPLDLLVEISAPAGLQAAVLAKTKELTGYYRPLVGFGAREGRESRFLDLTQSAEENDRWVFFSGRFEIDSASDERIVGAALRAVEEQFFDLPLPGRPGLMSDWSDWLRTPHLSNRTPPPPAEAFALRYRVVPRLEPGATD